MTVNVSIIVINDINVTVIGNHIKLLIFNVTINLKVFFQISTNPLLVPGWWAHFQMQISLYSSVQYSSVRPDLKWDSKLKFLNTINS